jgi:hypothetical protein
MPPSFATGALISRFGLERTTGAGLALITVSAVIERQGIWSVNVTKGLLNVKWMMKGLTTLTLAGALALSASPALSWYQGALKYRDYTVDAALVFAYYEKCNAGPIPPDLKGRADEKLNMAGPSAARWARGDVATLRRVPTRTEDRGEPRGDWWRAT